MKKKLILGILLFISSLGFSQIDATKIKVGGGLTLGSKSSFDDQLGEKLGLGIHIKGLYEITEVIDANLGFTLFFPKSPEHFDINMWQINTDATYSFYSIYKYKIYALAGFNLSHIKIKSSYGIYSYDESDTELGLDIGTGIKMDCGPFLEIKYDTSFEQLALTIGYMVKIKK